MPQFGVQIEKSPQLEEVLNRVQLRILHHGFSFGRTENGEKSLFTGFNRLYFFLKGAAEIRHENKRIPLRPGFAYFLPDSPSYFWNCPVGHEKFYIDFHLEIFPGRDLFEGQKEVRSFAFKELFSAKLPDFKILVSSTTLADSLFFKGLVFATLSGVFPPKPLRAFLTEIRLFEKYRPLFLEMEKTPPAAVSVAALGRAMNWNLSVLSRNFRRDTGSSLKHYLDLRVVALARTELLFSGKKIREISTGLGFGYETYFSRFFKKHTGQSPEAYRARLDEKN
ncbi:MAG: helix-turn-helix transcriptional regulator [Spirochaetia bacterium]|nr:helix-turn-helix transcriptional regulator [Spirochaetia bacterium]